MDATEPSSEELRPGARVVGIPRETAPGETRVALTPPAVPVLAKAGLRVLVESHAGLAAGFPDAAYVDKGASIAGFRDEVFAADIVLGVRPLANGEAPADLSRLRPDQVAGSVLQSASVSTIDAESHILVRLMRLGQQNEFVQRYGDTGEDEFDGRGGTIPQRLLLMNGKLVRERIGQSPLNASTRIAWIAPTDPNALPYVNIFATRAEDKDNATYQKLVEIFQTDPEVQAGLVEASGGTGVPVTTPVADLEASLAKVEADTEAAKG